MAQKRMFDKRVVESDKFTDLPNSSKALYFMAGMSADDRGFFQPRRIQKMCGFTDDDFKILIAKGYFIAFESGVMVVTEWNKNNWLDKRRITETEYIDELNLLKLINEKYELKDSGLAAAKQALSQNRIEENRIDKNSIKKEEDEEEEKELFEIYEENFSTLSTTTTETLISLKNIYTSKYVKEAMKRAIINNKKSLAYVKGILKQWKNKTWDEIINENTQKELGRKRADQLDIKPKRMELDEDDRKLYKAITGEEYQVMDQ